MIGQRVDGPALVSTEVERIGHALSGRRLGAALGSLWPGSGLVVCQPTIPPPEDRPCLIDRLHLPGVAAGVGVELPCEAAEGRPDGLVLGVPRHTEHRIGVAHRAILAGIDRANMGEKG